MSFRLHVPSSLLSFFCAHCPALSIFAHNVPSTQVSGGPGLDNAGWVHWLSPITSESTNSKGLTMCRCQLGVGPKQGRVGVSPPTQVIMEGIASVAVRLQRHKRQSDRSACRGRRRTWGTSHPRPRRRYQDAVPPRSRRGRAPSAYAHMGPRRGKLAPPPQPQKASLGGNRRGGQVAHPRTFASWQGHPGTIRLQLQGGQSGSSMAVSNCSVGGIQTAATNRRPQRCRGQCCEDPAQPLSNSASREAWFHWEAVGRSPLKVWKERWTCSSKERRAAVPVHTISPSWQPRTFALSRPPCHVFIFLSCCAHNCTFN